MAAAFLGLLTFASPTTAQEFPAAKRPAVEASFQGWLTSAVLPAARKAGVSERAVSEAFAGVTLDWSLPDLAPPGAPKHQGPQRQPEFSDPARYVAEANFAGLIPEGRKRLAADARAFAEAERRYGVPKEIVAAIWARESRYGSVPIRGDAIRNLATQSFMGARKERFFPELIAALKILDGDHLTRAEMKSSWAGAMGQPQFLPSKFLENAVDLDGDGRRDIWRSNADSIGSIAHYMQVHGWAKGRPWGVEASVPAAVSCTLEGPDQGLTLGEWRRLGVRRVDGDELPGEAGRKTFLLAPAGRAGPMFIVSENFYAIKQYNESDLYALFVAHLADRYGQGGPLRAGWHAAAKGFDRADVAAMQLRLQKRGYDVGKPDGLVGFRTRVAIGRWQEAGGLPPTCWPDAETVRSAGR
ncbi:membrane protein [Methylopila jiangsuensis]|uniref:Membrane protein n=1 Tax=Methylopila jiangsuensis TaxID=586230 RepID=A0A9W6N357_9HYPH|nr:lytic murein transglycosylase [Methylopila jiangsuensis]MDR6286151.1 lytic murein transglycosylase [Methylopila jiangsuensis]GLK75911.1 membrane protein [Methylopila jiangsuensis]